MKLKQKKQIRWPDEKPFGIWLSHDVDKVKKTFQYITQFFKQKRFYHLISMFYRENPYWTFDRIMKIEESLGVRSTFFFLHETKKFKLSEPSSFKTSVGYYDINMPKLKEVIRKLDTGGWEIGLHGSFDSYKDKALLKKEKEILEKILGKEVVGCRQHYLNLDIPKTWKFQRELGFQYDASFGESCSVGYREDKWYPFKPFKGRFIVLPLNIMDGPLFSTSNDIDDAYQKALQIMGIAEKKGTMLSILWHTNRMNSNEYPGQAEIYKKLIIEGQRRGAHFCLGRDLVNLI
jgi:peptidoglycan/xylan/chitin deacetylase (PgdA/CDA1 family)